MLCQAEAIIGEENPCEIQGGCGNPCIFAVTEIHLKATIGGLQRLQPCSNACVTYGSHY